MVSSKKYSMKLSVVIPILNEEDVIPELYKRLKSALQKDFKGFDYELIFIDDGSTDSSFEKLNTIRKKDKKIKILQFSRNFGQHTAISAGLKIANGTLTVIMDADLQDRPEEIINLYKKLNKGFNIVYSVRDYNNYPFFKEFTSKLFWFSIRFLTGLDIPSNQSMLKIFDRKVLNSVNQLEDTNPFYPAIFALVGYRQTIHLVKNDKRLKGKTKYSLGKMLYLAMNAILGYAYRRLSYIYFSTVFVIFILLIFYLVAYNRVFFISQSDFLIVFFTVVLFMIFVSIFYINISYYYFSKTFKNISKTPNYIVSNQLL
jgi:dolichol-phosphate mannosyltransferase